MDEETATQVWLSVHKLKIKDGKDIEPPKREVILTNDEEGIKLLFTLFKILKNEFIEREELIDGTMFKYLKTLAKEFDRDKDLTGAIMEKIKKLERYNFYKTSDFIEITTEEIIGWIKTLRDRRVDLWKSILENYIKNKDYYNKKLANHIKPKKFQD